MGVVLGTVELSESKKTAAVLGDPVRPSRNILCP